MDARAPQAMMDTLVKHGITVIPTQQHPDVYPAVAYHPDIMFHHIGENTIVYAPNTSKQMVNILIDMGFDMIEGKTILNKKYPLTIAYNIARVGKYAFHNTKYTDPVIIELLGKRGVELVHVNQGYSKCLTCIVNDNSIITSDRDIFNKSTERQLDALLIEPDKSIRLEPFDMGFFGGATGLIGNNKLAIAGNILFHKNSKEISNFLSLKAVDVVMLNDEQLLDLGTILPIIQE